jgi:hypothetical protein
MVVISAMLAFLIGISAASLVVVVVLSDKRNEVYWAFVSRHAIVGRLTKPVLSALAVACGLATAYLGTILLAADP